MDNKISDKRAIHLLISNTLVNSARIVFYIFLNIFIWKNTLDVQIIALFNIVYLTIHFISYPIFAPIVKLWYKKIINYISIYWLALVYLSVVILWENSINYIYYIAWTFGFFNWMYWINYHTQQFEVTNFQNRWNYTWMKKSLHTLSHIITPSIIGYIIWTNTFWYWFESAFAISIIMLLIAAYYWAIKLKKRKVTQFQFKKLFRKAHKDKDIFRSLYTYLFTWFAFWNTVLEVVIWIVIFTYVKNEADLGFILSLLSIISIILMYLFWKFVSYSKYKYAIIIIWILYSFILIWFISFESVYLIILFSALIKTFATFFSIPQKVISDNVLHKIKNCDDYRAEYVLLRELYLYTGWMISFIMLYFIDSIEANKLAYIFVVSIIFTLIAAFSLSKIDLTKIENTNPSS